MNTMYLHVPIKWALLISILFIANFAKADILKGDIYPAYVILNDDSRIEGLAVIGSLTECEVGVKFIRNGKKIKYKTKDLKAYGYEKTIFEKGKKPSKRWIHYERFKVETPPKPFAPKEVFIEREVEGEVSIYCYYIEQPANRVEPLKFEYFIKDTSGKVTIVDRKTYVQFAKKLFKDYRGLVKNIGKKHFEYRHLNRMVSDYNYWKENQHDAALYKISPELFTDKLKVVREAK